MPDASEEEKHKAQLLCFTLCWLNLRNRSAWHGYGSIASASIARPSASSPYQNSPPSPAFGIFLGVGIGGVRADITGYQLDMAVDEGIGAFMARIRDTVKGVFITGVDRFVARIAGFRPAVDLTKENDAGRLVDAVETVGPFGFEYIGVEAEMCRQPAVELRFGVRAVEDAAGGLVNGCHVVLRIAEIGEDGFPPGLLHPGFDFRLVIVAPELWCGQLMLIGVQADAEGQLPYIGGGLIGPGGSDGVADDRDENGGECTDDGQGGQQLDQAKRKG